MLYLRGTVMFYGTITYTYISVKLFANNVNFSFLYFFTRTPHTYSGYIIIVEMVLKYLQMNPSPCLYIHIVVNILNCCARIRLMLGNIIYYISFQSFFGIKYIRFIYLDINNVFVYIYD